MTQPDGKMNIKDIPYSEQKEMCALLDQEKKWLELAKQMGFDDFTITTKFCNLQGKSPSFEVFTRWAFYDHNVLELFVLLGRVGAYNCMLIIKKYIPMQHQKKIKINNNFQQVQISNSKVEPQNFMKNTTKPGPNKSILDTTDNNATIQNTPGIPNNNPLESTLNIPEGLDSEDLSKFLQNCVVENAGSTAKIRFEELQVATKDWTELIGKGGFGKVYKGYWKYTDVAIKVLELKNNSSKTKTYEHIKQSITELKYLNRYRHDNILSLYGYSVDGPNPCLVYQYMKNGSLDYRLRGSSSKKPETWLSWRSRLNIAIGVSRGIQFLHTVLTDDNKPLVHCDIKSGNILLDNQDQPRIGDFGLARKGPEITQENMEVSKIQGTLPYLPMDFLKDKQFSVKVDVYSFGVVLFELGTGLPPSLLRREKQYLRDYVITYPRENLSNLKDTNVPEGNYIYENLIEVGKRCVETMAKDRPDMVMVLETLQKIDSHI